MHVNTTLRTGRPGRNWRHRALVLATLALVASFNFVGSAANANARTCRGAVVNMSNITVLNSDNFHDVTVYGPSVKAEQGETQLKTTTHIWGTPGDDVIIGTPGNDWIRGLGGNDIICGLSGNDVINGGHGNDILSGNGGQDRISGSFGTDKVFGGAGIDETVYYPNQGDSVDTGGQVWDLTPRSESTRGQRAGSFWWA